MTRYCGARGVIRLLCCVGIALGLSFSRAVWAQGYQPPVDQAKLIRQVQEALIWTGHYEGLIDGQLGRHTRQAWASFQRSVGATDGGVPDANSVRTLFRIAQANKSRVGFDIVRDAYAQVIVGLPIKLAPVTQPTRRGTAYTSRDGSLKIDTLRFGHGERTLVQLYEQVQRGPIRTVMYAKPPRSGDFVLSGMDHEKHYYFRAVQAPDGIFAFSVAYAQHRDRELRPVVVAIASHFAPASLFRDRPNEHQARDASASPKSSDDQSTSKPWSPSSGTGFVVSDRGHVLTNAHVVDGCGTVNVVASGESNSPARKVAADGKNDLALLQLGSPHQGSVARFKATYRLGESVSAFGFPLSQLLATSGNFATGTITATAGLGDDFRMLQISTPVQPGNSGGPLLDASGNVVGVVVGKLNAIGVLRQTGDIAQNVNFAIKSSIAEEFLRTHGIEPERATATEAIQPADIAELAKKFTVRVVCSSPG